MFKRLFKRKPFEKESDKMTKHLTVKRKARVGERILITKRASHLDPYKNGDTFTVFASHNTGVEAGQRGYCVFECEYEVIVENAVDRIAYPGDTIVLKNGGCEYDVSDSVSYHPETSMFGGHVITTNGLQFPDSCYYVIEEKPQDDPHTKHIASLSQEVAQLKRRVSELESDEPLRASTPGTRFGKRVTAIDKPVNITMNSTFEIRKESDVGEVARQLAESIRKGLR